MRFFVVMVFFILSCNICAKLQSLTWRPLFAREIGDWYSTTNLCLLNSSDSSLKVQDLRSKYCPLTKVGQYPMCEIGYGHRVSPCYGPFLLRKSAFLSGFDGYTDAHAKPIHILLRSLGGTNITLLAIGDSVMIQRMFALLCQLLKEGGTISAVGQDSWILKATNSVNSTTLHIRHVDDPSTAHFISNLVANNAHFMVLLNSGLHWKTPENYTQHLDSVLPFYASLVLDDPLSKNSLIYLETTHQSFPNPIYNNGYYHEDAANIHFLRMQQIEKEEGMKNHTIASRPNYFREICPPPTNFSIQADWRNFIAFHKISLWKGGRNHGGSSATRISIYSTHQALVNLSDLFTSGRGARKFDCTHFCYHPLMWQPMFHFIAEFAKRMYNPHDDHSDHDAASTM
jgi:hypothetical protein